MTPLISVVMPTYNSEKHVAEAIESILKQTICDFEFLIVNEYQTCDRTIEIANSFHDPRIRVIQKNDPVPGIARSLNIGIQQSMGKYIARIDSDDISIPTRFEKQVAFMETNPDVGVCGGWAKVFGKVNGFHKPPILHEDIAVQLLFRCELSHTTIMMRKNDLIAHDLWYDPAFFAEDHELWARAVHVVKFATIPEILAHYRVTGFNQTIKYAELSRERDQDFFEQNFKRLGINYKKDYPDILTSEWHGVLEHVSEDKWKETIDLLKKLFKEIVSQNKKLGIYDEQALWRCLQMQYMSSLDISDTIRNDYKLLPFELLADDIIYELEPKLDGRRFCMFGLGRIGSRLLPHFKRRFNSQLVCVSDNAPEKWGNKFYECECVNPESIPKDLAVVVTTGYDFMMEIIPHLKRMGFADVYPFAQIYDYPKGKE